MPTIDINSELELARRFIEQTDTNVFLTGRAGTGKTTFLRMLREESPKRMIVVAPTGVAAINAGGVTIHSFFQLPLSPYIPGMAYSEGGRKQFSFSKEKKNILRSLDLLVIDEISMVRADLLDAIDSVLRRYKDHSRPFGGVQLLMIGDLQQLSPVVKDSEKAMLEAHYRTLYFFGSKALSQSNYVTIELKTIYRQTDPKFVGILNAIRERRITSELLAQLNERVLPSGSFQEGRFDGYIRLTTHNHTAHRYNELQLASLSGKAYTYQAEVEGNFAEQLYPADYTLQLKEGAQVMFIRNDESGQGRYYNGKIGHVKMLTSQGIMVRCEDGTSFTVEKSEWTNKRYTIDEESKEIREEVDGTFRQYPLRLAWAITIHKSQGLTFEKAVIDAASSFSHGQVYVALSRCKSLEGLLLASPVTKQSIINDDTVSDFMRTGEILTQEATRLLGQLQNNYFCKLLDELFGFGTLQRDFGVVLRLIDEYFYRLYPKLLEQYKQTADTFKQKITTVEENFRKQYTRILKDINPSDLTEGRNTDSGQQVEQPEPLHAMQESERNLSLLQERIHSAAAYFLQTLKELMDDLLFQTRIETDNKAIGKRTDEALSNLRETYRVKCELMNEFTTSPFSVPAYLQSKAIAILGDDRQRTKARKRRHDEYGLKHNLSLSESGGIQNSEKVKQESFTSEPMKRGNDDTDVLYPILFSEIREWRRKKAEELAMPAYTILQQKALIGMVNHMPNTLEELIEIPYFGKLSADKFGEEILAIIRNYAERNPDDFNNRCRMVTKQMLREQRKAKYARQKAEREELIAAHKQSKIEREKERAERAKSKENSKEISYLLYKEGISIEKIAEMRQLVKSTILGHLAYYVTLGKLSLDSFVSKEKADSIRKVLSETSFLFEAKERLGDDVSYDEIRIVQAEMKRTSMNE